MRRHDVAFFATVGCAIAAIVAVVLSHVLLALGFGAATIASAATARYWSRKHPAPFPAYLRWMLAVPHPVASPRLFRRALMPQPGERILEIGPGAGQMAIRVAGWIAPDGTLDVFDIQQEMLDATMERARKRRVENITASRGQAGERLPYPDDAFDAAYLITVLGEIPDQQAAVRQLERVLRPGGRLLVGEFFLDPDFVPIRRLKEMGAEAGLSFGRRFGPRFGYHARFDAA